MTPPGPAPNSARPDDPAAWAAVVRAHRAEFTRLARAAIQGHARNKVDPEDVVQDAFLLAFERRGQFRGTTPAEFSGWLRRILASQLARVVRRYHETRARAGEEAAAGLEPADPGTSPSRGAARRETVGRVDAALARIPEVYQMVLILRERNGRPFAEIAARLGRSETATRKLWSRAVLALRDEMAPHDAPSAG